MEHGIQHENIGVCVIFHVELRFQLHHTSSRKCNNTWLRDLIINAKSRSDFVRRVSAKHHTADSTAG